MTAMLGTSIPVLIIIVIVIIIIIIIIIRMLLIIGRPHRTRPRAIPLAIIP